MSVRVYLLHRSVKLTYRTGCMESLVHYKQLLVRSHSAMLAPKEGDNLIATCLDLLRQLETIDPLRKQRYNDLGTLHTTAFLAGILTDTATMITDGKQFVVT